MLKQLLYISSIILFISIVLLGCGDKDTTTAPYNSTIFVDPASITFNVETTVPLDYIDTEYINIWVEDEFGNVKNNQDLFFSCANCTNGTVELRDNARNLIDVSSGDVHGTTGDSGNFILWVYFLAGQGATYIDTIRITSGANESAYVDLSVGIK